MVACQRPCHLNLKNGEMDETLKGSDACSFFKRLQFQRIFSHPVNGHVNSRPGQPGKKILSEGFWPQVRIGKVGWSEKETTKWRENRLVYLRAVQKLIRPSFYMNHFWDFPSTQLLHSFRNFCCHL